MTVTFHAQNRLRITMTSRFGLCFLLIFLAITSIELGRPAKAQTVDFSTQVRPILSEKCFLCHGPDASTREADLRLDQASSATAMLSQSGTGKSKLLERITAHDPAERMPPAESRKQLSPDQIQTLTRWIAAGAPYARHWSFEVPQRGTLPKTASDPWCSTPIDAFILDRLRAAELNPSPSADPSTLVRRLVLDLNGLPPTPEERQEFLQAVELIGMEVAYERLLDRLFASPRYGEQMALPWLEAARYADTDGYQNDRYRYQHAWRDWVIRAYNENMPYDQFVIEQLAGDLLPNATLWQQVASGFGRNHRINSEDGSIPEEWLTENVVDRVDTLGTVFMGLTVGCARCHDHKYDPISQTEYYQLFAFFNNIAEHGVGPNNGNSPPFVELPKNWPLLSNEENHAITPEPVQLRRSREKDDGNGLQRPQAGSPETVMVMHELNQPRETYLLVRGQYNVPDKSQRLWPKVPQALVVEGQGTTPTSRLELAQWLVSRQNTLSARVAVNRLWQQFFGVGLVESSENFGSQGTAPSHPQLLDWLAVELMDSHWDLRHIQKQILLSSTYRQSSQWTDELLATDPKNRLLARGPRIREPAFVLRDQALAMSGLLVNQVGGPSVKPYMPADIWSAISNNKYVQDKGEKLFRRSLYTYWRRTIPPPTMMNFNAAAREVCSVRTDLTNTPLQALTLMNNLVFVESAKKLAERSFQTEADASGRIMDCFVRCVSRTPTTAETQLLHKAHDAFLMNYQQDASAAREFLSTSGEAPYDQELDAVQLAALTMTVSMIMNLDEAITKE